MATETIGFLDEVVGGPAHLVGWSDGGIVGLLVAEYRPDLVTKLVAIGANFDPTDLVPEFLETITHADPGGEGLSALRSLHQAHSPDGPEQWPILCRKFTEMITREPQMTVDELGRISAPTLVMVGDDDAVTLEHTLALYRAIPNAELAVVPGTSHMLPMEKPDLVNRIVLGFLRNEPVATRLPIRRAEVDADAH